MRRTPCATSEALHLPHDVYGMCIPHVYGMYMEHEQVRYLRGEPITSFLVDRELAARLDEENGPVMGPAPSFE